MKIIKILFIPLTVLLFGTAIGQENKKKSTEITFKVDGVCGQCKKRIERALDVKGIRFAEWNVKTHDCTVVYKPAIISKQKIFELITTVGHDTEELKASDEAYNNLHHCCKYR